MLSRKVVYIALYFLFVYGCSARALQTAEQRGGSASIYDSNGKLVTITDATGNKMRPDGTLLGGPSSGPQKSTSAMRNSAPVTIHVPADQPTIQAAINAASPGDTILISDGTYKESINFNGKAVTVTSVHGPAVTTIDGGKLSTVVLFVTAETSASILNGFTITNGFAGFQSPNFGEGGGIAVENASPTITNNVITGNAGCEGVGIGIGFGSPLVQGNTISNNTQAGCSGGIGGGGISIRGESSGTQIISNTISGNSMPAGGGGIALFAAGGPLIENNIFTGNNGFGQGGGIVMFNNASPQIINNIFVHNTAAQGGGLYWLIPQSTPGILLLNNTIVGNTATQGSGVFNSGFASNATLQNNIISGQPGINAVFCESFNNNAPPIFTANDVFTTDATPYGGICTDQTSVNGNISADPLLTDVAVENLHLQPLSPAIDAGSNTAPVTLPLGDLDGHPRIHNAIVDIGAFEFQDLTTATFSTTSLVFSQQLVGTKSPAQTVTITNTGAVALQVTPFVLSGDFTETDNCHTSGGILPGASCIMNILFAPTARFARTGQLGVISNDSAGPTTINLSGTGIAPVVTLSASGLNFNTQLVGSTSTAQPITINNIGDAPLTITSIAATGDFSQTNNCGVSVAVNSNCIINVTFTPTLRGLRNGSVTITDNAAGNPHAVTLQGSGIGPAVTVGATSLIFSGQFTGTTSIAQTIVLTSVGEAALNISSITTTGDFAQTNNCGTSLTPTQFCTVQVTFSPTGQGLRGGLLKIIDNSTSSPENVGLSGVGTDFSIGSQPGGSSTATVTAGGTATYNLAIIGTAGAIGTVSFACSGAPAASTCTVNPPSAPLSGGLPVNFSVVVATTARGSAAPLSLRMRPWVPGLYPSLVAWIILALLLAIHFRGAKLRRRALLASFGLMLVMLIASCGGGGGGTPPPPPVPQSGTPAGTSILAVTATSGGATRTFNLTLVVH